MRPPQHFFTALDFSKLPGRWVLPCHSEGVQGERSVPLGPRVCLQTQWSVVLGLQINKIVC